MKATISELDAIEQPLWEGEMVSATWDSEKGEFVIRGDADNWAFTTVIKCIKEKLELAIGIEDAGSTQLILRGFVGNADFTTFGSEEMECCLDMSVQDWWGIFPRFSGFYFS